MKASYIEDFETWAEDFSFSTNLRVRFSETDMYGHLNNTVNFTYFEYARIEFFKHLKLSGWSDDTQSDDEKIPVVADLQCDYLQQVFFDELLTIYVKAAKVGSSSMDLHYLAKNEKGQPVFVGRGTIVQINKKTGKPAPWAEEERQLLLGK